MALVQLVAVLAILQFIAFAMLVGKARGTYGIKAPAVTGHDVFERYYRVQMNTLEQLVVFLPALWLGAQHLNPLWAAALGVVYLIGRQLYLRAYVSDPASRGLGFLLTFLPSVLLLLAALVGAVRSLMAA
ncbi:MAG: MAPEG family protein [Steroidobacteraceae bacterium]|jgi:uncharacterized membrane protein YecN with MAPEG domain